MVIAPVQLPQTKVQEKLMKFTKVKLMEVADIRFCINPSQQTHDKVKSALWIGVANLLPDNEITTPESNNKFTPREEFRIQKNDILVRRLSPQFVNWVQTDYSEPVYATNNLVLIRPWSNVDPAFLALSLNRQIPLLNTKSSSSHLVTSIVRAELNAVEIPFPPLETQQKLGKVWTLSLEKKRLQTLLLNTEFQYTTQIINMFMENPS